jgi:hypothetical protein
MPTLTELKHIGRSDKLTLDTELFRFSRHGEDRMTLGEVVQGMLVLGENGSGKTSSLRTVARGFLQAGMGGVVVCVKADEFEAWQMLAAETGRAADLVEFAPVKQAFNFINHETKGQTEPPIENLVSLLAEAGGVMQRKSEDDFWMRAAKQLLRSLLTIVYCARGEITVTDLYTAMANLPQWNDNTDEAEKQEWMNSPLGEMIDNAHLPHPDLPASVEYVMKEWANRDRRTNAGISLNLSEMMDILRRTPLIGTLGGKTTITPDACREGKIIVLNVPVKTMGEVGRILQIIFKLSAQRSFERLTTGKPVFLWADECQYITSPNDTLFCSTARSARAATVYITQNLPLWIAELGGGSAAERRIKGLIGNLPTKIFFLNSDQETNKWAADMIDKETQERKTKSRQEGRSSGRLSSGSSVSSAETIDYICRPAEFQKLQWGGSRWNCICTGIVYKTGRRWSNGKRFLIAQFDQKRRLHTHRAIWLWVSTTALVGTGVFVGRLSLAGNLDLPREVPRWIWFKPRLREIYVFLALHGPQIYPALAAIIAGLLLFSLLRNAGTLACARET